VDTRLRVTDPSLKFERTAICQALVQALAIAESFDERKISPARLVPCAVGLMVNEFILQGTEEAFHDRIVVAVAFAAHARHQPEGLEAISVDERAVLRPLVGVMDETPGGPAATSRPW